MCFAHLTAQRGPFYGGAVFVFGDVELFAQPGPKAENVDVSYRAYAFTGADEWVGVLTRLETDSACGLILCRDGHYFIVG
jgi:hypothetical protein